MMRRALVLIASLLLVAPDHSTTGLFVSTALGTTIPPQAGIDPLRSWNDGAAKRAIIAFVGDVTKEGGPDFVPVPERIATFDNDGTLWAEKPVPFQALFAFDRVKALAPQHPEWKTKEPFASLLKGDMAGVAAMGRARVRDSSRAGSRLERKAEARDAERPPRAREARRGRSRG